MSLPAFMDMTGRKCGGHIGWFGCVGDAPDCPHCGAEPPREDLRRDEARLDEVRRLLSTKDQDGPTFRKQRELAGLLPGQAARLLGIMIDQLHALEDGKVKPNAAMAQKIAEVYQLDNSPEGE